MLTLARVRRSTTTVHIAWLVTETPLPVQSSTGGSHEALAADLPRYDASIHEKDQAAKPVVRAPKNAPNLIPESQPVKPAPGTRECFQTRFVILNAVKDPRHRRPYRERKHGFFTSFRMTENGYWLGLKTLPNDTPGADVLQRPTVTVNGIMRHT